MWAKEVWNFWEESNEQGTLFQEEQESTNDAMAFLGEQEALPIVESHQRILDDQNNKIADLVNKNIWKTEEEISDWFQWSVSVWYSKINRSTPEKIKKNKIGYVWDYSDFENYHTTNEIQNQRNQVSFLEQQNRNLEWRRQEVVDRYNEFRSNLTRQANAWEITWDEVYERDREFWDYENWWIIETRGIDEEINNNENSIYNWEEIIEAHERRELTKYSSDILDSFKEARSKGLNVTEVLKDKYRNASEDDKIKLLQTVWDKMGDNYNYDLMNTPGDVEGDKMWNSIVDENLLWWVCRHIHSEIAILAEWLWMTAWMISTNVGWEDSWAHAITLLRKEDWSFALIDYWNVYVWRNFNELQTDYLDKKWATILHQMITDPEWNPLRFFQTEWSKLFWENLSALWTQDTLKKSKEIARDWLDVTNWLHINVNTWSSTNVSATYWNWSISWEVYYNNDNSWLYKKYDSYGVKLKWKIWDRSWLGELWAVVNLSEHNFKYFSWKENSYQWASIAWTYSKEIVNNDKYNINFWVAWQVNENFKKLKLDEWSSWEASIWATIDWEYYASEDLTLKWNISYWWEAWWNMRSEEFDTIKLYWKQSIWAWFEYKWEWYTIWADWYYEKWPGYKEIWWNLNVDIWNDLEFTAWYSKNSDTTKFKIWDNVKKEIWVVYNITDTLNLKSSYSSSDNYWTKSDNFYVWGEWRF